MCLTRCAVGGAQGGVNCLRSKRYRLRLPPPLPSLLGLPRTGKQAGVWKVPDALVMLLVMLVTLLPFSVYLFHEIPDS